MKKLHWILLHQEQSNLVRVNVDDGRGQDLDIKLSDLPTEIQDSINKVKELLCSYYQAELYIPKE